MLKSNMYLIFKRITKIDSNLLTSQHKLPSLKTSKQIEWNVSENLYTYLINALLLFKIIFLSLRLNFSFHRIKWTIMILRREFRNKTPPKVFEGIRCSTNSNSSYFIMAIACPIVVCVRWKVFHCIPTPLRICCRVPLNIHVKVI